jgi:hypothetical protein
MASKIRSMPSDSFFALSLYSSSEISEELPP